MWMDGGGQSVQLQKHRQGKDEQIYLKSKGPDENFYSKNRHSSNTLCRVRVLAALMHTYLDHYKPINLH